MILRYILEDMDASDSEDFLDTLQLAGTQRPLETVAQHRKPQRGPPSDSESESQEDSQEDYQEDFQDDEFETSPSYMSTPSSSLMPVLLYMSLL